MTGTVLFDPLLPWPVLAALAAIAAAGVALAIWRGLTGWALRALAALVVLGALAGPSWQREDRAPLSDIVLMAVDGSSSQQLGDRADMTENAAREIEAAIAARPNTELRRIELGDGEDDTGTQLMTAINEALAEEPRGRIAGVIALSDGRVHDADLGLDMPAPFHLLHTGREEDWDRRLVVENAPAFAILGEPVTLTIRIEDMGAAPQENAMAQLDISVDGGEPQSFDLRVGRTVELPLELPHGGRNVIQFSVPEAEGELTDRNNTALVQINGVRDRLRVLLVSGEPHAGGRTWRNLLKSDSSVDLVHFTILRPPEKQDGVPVNELSLIAFPTRELFMEKIEDFDLIIFDRYKRRGILPSLYLDNVRNYVETGGAVLIAAGPDFASADSIYRSPLSQVVPAEPTARVIEQGYTPSVTDIGQRHPVTAGLAPDGAGDWGRWMRQIEVEPRAGHVVMSGAEEKPLLVLDRVGEGRIALLASDQAWLWDRGFEGGGPQLELLRRLAHWMMKEPELEEEAIWAEPTGQTMRIIRRTLEDSVGDVTVTTPSGEEVQVPLRELRPGQYEAIYRGPEIGLYRLQEGEEEAVIGLGPAAPREFVQTIATDAVLRPVIDAGRGGAVALAAEGVPQIRAVREGRPAAGRGWIGITPRDAYQTLDVTKVPLLPQWLVLLLASALIVGAWLREGRR
ncbi:hypothetical protein M8756_10645 [Lutimaribacter sp. EGI FJ00015]|uniref:Uncharacterized protein n=1 Tax=Lutimaribacter degradans TaxID=2945989 RepID=A0ACC5ZX17_9RHOB|nr:hypothetical protein [Lutimaribacter sp. EGI FJ00013]MCM2562606.1 hypothetical protein [Lutimaribacter sp. EGI FJ00013]MCO0613763.1 hypothetical protein [Lutimaribacter sp. EGI FJ00015]MCO0636754.1 hypothetical protein [Lutimaribacter sp. EGI FJ00014]